MLYIGGMGKFRVFLFNGSIDTLPLLAATRQCMKLLVAAFQLNMKMRDQTFVAEWRHMIARLVAPLGCFVQDLL